VRGTVQADILKEDQGQNTCIFSTEFSLKVMGDIAEYFVHHDVRNFYSVSISGYHIAEAGANPISQLAFTLSNGFTFVEAYLARGMHIDDFAPNLSFFFSNGMDPEYTVLGRVARRIWAVAMRDRYGANERSQKLKYHIQTSGRSLHAQEIQFNDIRTTLQALIAVYDNCNSLHTNAFDEAITTPTEDSVRRAMAIQLIINREWGLAKNENPNQGAFVIDELTELVEEAVLAEFEKIADRGGVLGAMETGYQRSKIQEESMHYEMLKHTGEYPIIGVNTFRNPHGDAVPDHHRAGAQHRREKQSSSAAWPTSTAARHADAGAAEAATRDARPPAAAAVIENRNVFEVLMDAVTLLLAGADHEPAAPVRGGRAVPAQHVPPRPAVRPPAPPPGPAARRAGVAPRWRCTAWWPASVAPAPSRIGRATKAASRPAAANGVERQHGVHGVALHQVQDGRHAFDFQRHAGLQPGLGQHRLQPHADGVRAAGDHQFQRASSASEMPGPPAAPPRRRRAPRPGRAARPAPAAGRWPGRRGVVDHGAVDAALHQPFQRVGRQAFHHGERGAWGSARERPRPAAP
jgi:hypothetical protein